MREAANQASEAYREEMDAALQTSSPVMLDPMGRRASPTCKRSTHQGQHVFLGLGISTPHLMSGEVIERALHRHFTSAPFSGAGLFVARHARKAGIRPPEYLGLRPALVGYTALLGVDEPCVRGMIGVVSQQR